MTRHCVLGPEHQDPGLSTNIARSWPGGTPISLICTGTHALHKIFIKFLIRVRWLANYLSPESLVLRQQLPGI